MPVPETRHNMIRAGYELLSTEKFSVCKGCGEFIEWWKTTRGKHIPFDPAGEHETAVCHWGTCKKVEDDRERAYLAPEKARPSGGASLAGELNRLREHFNARVVVLVDDVGITSSWRPGVPAEELRADLIAAGNSVRRRALEGAPK